MNPEVMFARGVTSELRFETADTLREPANSEATLRTVTLAKVAVKLVVRDSKLETEMTFRVVTLAVEAIKLVLKEFKFEIVKTLRVATFATDAIRLVVRLARLETEMTFRTVALTEAAKSVETFAVPKT